MITPHRLLICALIILSFVLGLLETEAGPDPWHHEERGLVLEAGEVVRIDLHVPGKDAKETYGLALLNMKGQPLWELYAQAGSNTYTLHHASGRYGTKIPVEAQSLNISFECVDGERWLARVTADYGRDDHTWLFAGKLIQQADRVIAGYSAWNTGRKKLVRLTDVSVRSGSLNIGMPDRSYTVVDTGQEAFFSDRRQIREPGQGARYYGQDACYEGVTAQYQDNGDGTVTDLRTGLMWQRSPDLAEKVSFEDAMSGADDLELAGYSDWRMPTVKELYSLIDFNGNSRTGDAYCNTNYFDFRFGEGSSQERVIDAQYFSSTEYVGSTMNGQDTVFGVNFADGRIKGYPKDSSNHRGNRGKRFVRYVRGNPGYGENQFVDNGDGTVTDEATGLMWQKADSGTKRLNWEEALAYAEGLALAGHSDWRLPNIKELQSLVDYSRAPDAAVSVLAGPAINTNFFEVTAVEAYYWSSTTHLEGPAGAGAAAYIAFGQAWGNMNGRGWINVHGAGAQRSDPKSGDPSRWADGLGPQGDEIRIYNYVRCVRDA